MIGIVTWEDCNFLSVTIIPDHCCCSVIKQDLHILGVPHKRRNIDIGCERKVGHVALARIHCISVFKDPSSNLCLDTVWKIKKYHRTQHFLNLKLH